MGRPRAVVLGSNHWHTPLYVEGLKRSFELVEVDADRLAPGDADLAVVLAPHTQMQRLASRAVDAGIPILLEKPGGRMLVELTSLADAARKAGVDVIVPFVHRFSPLADSLAVLEDPVHFSASYLVGPPSRYPSSGSAWVLDPAVAGGGVLANLGPHFIDLFRMLTGAEVTDVQCRITSTLHGGEVEDHAALLLGTNDGRTGVIEVGYTTPSNETKRHAGFTLTGRDGFVSVASTGDVLTIASHGAVAATQINVDTDYLYSGFVNRVASHLVDRLAGLPTLDDLIEAMRVVRLAYRRAERSDMPWAT